MAQISREDLLTLNLQKAEVQKAQMEIDLATQKYNVQQMEFRYFVLSLYRKYSIPDNYKIQEGDGSIVDMSPAQMQIKEPKPMEAAQKNDGDAPNG